MQRILYSTTIVSLILGFGISVVTPLKKTRQSNYFPDNNLSLATGNGDANYHLNSGGGIQRYRQSGGYRQPGGYHGSGPRIPHSDTNQAYNAPHSDVLQEYDTPQSNPNQEYGDDNRQYDANQSTYSVGGDKGRPGKGHQKSGFRNEYHRVEYGHRTKYYDNYGGGGFSNDNYDNGRYKSCGETKNKHDHHQSNTDQHY